MWSEAATGPACSLVNCSGARLVRSDADEIGAHPDLVEQPLEVDVLRLEARVADAARRVDDDAVGAGADVDGLRSRVFPRAEDLLAVRAQHADRVGQLLGVRERARRLGPQDERDRLDVARLGEPPERAQERHVSARPRRALEADPHGVRRGRAAPAACSPRAPPSRTRPPTAPKPLPKSAPPPAVSPPKCSSSPAVPSTPRSLSLSRCAISTLA